LIDDTAAMEVLLAPRTAEALLGPCEPTDDELASHISPLAATAAAGGGGGGGDGRDGKVHSGDGGDDDGDGDDDGNGNESGGGIQEMRRAGSYPRRASKAAQRKLHELQGKRLECTIKLDYLVKKNRKKVDRRDKGEEAKVEGREGGPDGVSEFLRPYITAVRILL